MEMISEVSPRFYVHTFGCQMNEYDSFRMETLLERVGFQRASTPDSAHLILINSCSVREKAENKAFSSLGRYLRLKKLSCRPVVVGFGGCVGALKKEAILKQFPFVDFVFSPSEAGEIVSLLEPFKERLFGGAEFPAQEMAQLIAGTTPIVSLLTAQIGCNRACSYCVVPRARGREVSRPVEAVYHEACELVRRGAREIMLLGQVIDAYHGCGEDGSEKDLAYLCKRVAQIDAVKRIRFTTSHPNHLKPEIIRAFEEVPKLCRYLHVPFQAGSDRILKLMRRGYTRESYLEKIAEIRRAVPDIALSADCIVGFPGETESEFLETVDVIERVGFDQIYSFVFSARPGTPASEMADPVPADEKKRRLSHFQSVQGNIGLEKNMRLVGSQESVLVEGVSKNQAERFVGRTRSNKVVTFAPGDRRIETLIGEEILMRIVSATANALKGEML